MAALFNFINLTPHAISVRKENGSTFTVEPSGIVARVATHEQKIGELDGVPLMKRSFGEVENLPEVKEGTIYIVSSLVLPAAAAAGRTDVVAPDTGATAIRDENGHIVAVTRFVAP